MTNKETNVSPDMEIPQLGEDTNHNDPNVPLHLDAENMLQLTANHFVSNRAIILGQTGAGKGNAGALFIEQLLVCGLPMTIIDPEGEAWSLRDITPNLLVVGRSPHADREYRPDQMGRLAELSIEKRFSIVLDLSGYSDEEAYSLLLPYLTSLWSCCDTLRQPYHLVIDECHEFIPQVGKTPVKDLLIRIAKRGRKRGLGLIAMSQETASIDNKFLRQTDIRMLLRVSYPSDLERYSSLIPNMSKETIEKGIPQLPAGKGYLLYNHVPYLVQLLRRKSFDPSETPKLGGPSHAHEIDPVNTATLHLIDEELPQQEEVGLEYMDRLLLAQRVRELTTALKNARQKLAVPQKETKQTAAAVQPREKRLTQSEERIQTLQVQLQEKGTENLRLREQIELLGQIRVSIDGTRDHTRTLASHLAIENATIQQVNLPDILIPLPLTNSLDLPQETNNPAVLPPVQAKRLQAIKQHLAKLSKLDRDILELLYQQGEPLTIKQIAFWLVGSESTISKNPPLPLIEMGILAREKKGGHYVYRSVLDDYIQRHFPGNDYKSIIEDLLSK